MKVTHYLLIASTGAAVWAYTDPTVLSVAVLVLAVWLTGRWIRRRPKPRLDKAREFAQPRAASAKTVVRRGDRARRQHGLASASEVRRHGSARTVRKLAPVVRPSLAELGPITRARTVRARDVGVKLCKVGRRQVWASVEDFVLAIAAPRSFKSGWIASALVDYPGSAVATSLRPDLYTATHQHRAKRGAVYVFNAAGLSNLPTVTFDPLQGCGAADVATERAEDMVPSATGEQERWASLARSALASLMHAAALGGHTMDIVQRWVADPDTHKSTVIRLLRGSPSKTVVEDARQFLENNERTRSSITTSIMPALRWLQSPEARRAAGLEGDGQPFRVEHLLDSVSTLYILGRAETAVSPLMAALTGYVARNARRRAATLMSGRLDPPLGLHLDEAANSRPPLPDWTSDMGGSGITILAVFQSRAQMIEKWGREGAGIILNNAGAIMLGGGTKDPDDLAAWSDLAGKRDERTETTNKQGQVVSASQRQVAVLPAAQLANLPPGQVVVFRRGMLPAIGQVQTVWERWDLRLLPLVERAKGWISTSPQVEISTPLSSPRVSPVTSPSVVEEVEAHV